MYFYTNTSYETLHMLTGIEVDYRGRIAGIEPGRATVRCLLLCWTGDLPAQCEVGKFIFNGIHPCRRDELKGICLDTKQW